MSDADLGDARGARCREAGLIGRLREPDLGADAHRRFSPLKGSARRRNYHHGSYVLGGCAMRRKSFGNMQCPIARSLERVGEWWSILILRDAFYGLKRFDEFQENLGVAPGMLARRLNALVASGLLERRRYSEHPPRDEYVLTERGRDFRPVLLALLAWGNRHFAPEGAAVQLANRQTGAIVEPVLVDGATGEPIAGRDFIVVPGPGADDGVRERLARRGHRPFAQGDAA
jgi:DNA-binding HxlR family transcriptional regulator